MISLDSARYDLPTWKKMKGNSHVWFVTDRNKREQRMSLELNFTILPEDADRLGLGHVEERLTFYYGPNHSIKASPRTLRRFGAVSVGPIISKLQRVALDDRAPSPGVFSANWHPEEELSSARLLAAINNVRITNEELLTLMSKYPDDWQSMILKAR
jgi:hypothetical protein